jgi:hypothetical protein
LIRKLCLGNISGLVEKLPKRVVILSAFQKKLKFCLGLKRKKARVCCGACGVEL